MGVTRAVSVAKESLNDVMAELGNDRRIRCGSGDVRRAAVAFRMLDTMNHGGRIAMLGIPPSDMSIDWTKVIFGACSLKVFMVVNVRNVVQNGGADPVRSGSVTDYHPSFLY
ncbi:hypothetical protein KCP74_06365 [Salmonella enterica subsp. enterica]|nr:hypothetical protein KCP74_06365 [Salmonella enterica subsp. enterica]